MEEKGRKVTVPEIVGMKRRGEKIVCLTAYDYPTARLVDRAGVDLILVGDSLGMVVLGLPSTLPVTVEDIVRHTQAVSRAVERALVVADMPFMSYQPSVEEAVKNAGRMVKEGGAEAVKVEGARHLEAIRAIVESGIPVMGHVGMTPQFMHEFGGFRVRGKEAEMARKVMEDAIRLEEVGCFSVVLECVPWQLAKAITERLSIPTIGIGAGPYCDGQILVIHDVIGLFEGFRPKFVKQYANIAGEIERALSEYAAEVREGKFPGLEHSYTIPEEELEEALREVGQDEGRGKNS